MSEANVEENQQDQVEPEKEDPVEPKEKDDKEARRLQRLQKQIQTSLNESYTHVENAAESVKRKRRLCAEADQKISMKFSKGKDGQFVATSPTEEETTRSPAQKRETPDTPGSEARAKRVRRKSNASALFDESGPSNESNIECSFCWKCHKEGATVNCVTCPRLFHEKCVTKTAQNQCPECNGSLLGDSEERSGSNRLKLDLFCQLLKFALTRMKEVQGSSAFMSAVDPGKFPKYRTYIKNPMDLDLLSANIDKRMYGSTVSFHADAKWIYHNSIIFNGKSSHFTATASNILKTCHQELEEIDKCSDCYYNAHTKSDWFIQVCKKPHLLIWGRLKGYPFWPAKVLTVNPARQAVDARFFGEHDKAWIPIKDCYLYSHNCPPSTCTKRGDIGAAFAEINAHIAKLRDKFGFAFAADKVLYDPEQHDTQLAKMMPEWTPLVSKPNPIPPQELTIEEDPKQGEKESVDVQPTESSSKSSEKAKKSSASSATDTPAKSSKSNASRSEKDSEKSLDETASTSSVGSEVVVYNPVRSKKSKEKRNKTPQPESNLELVPVEIKQENLEDGEVLAICEGRTEPSCGTKTPMVAITKLNMLSISEPAAATPKVGLKRNPAIAMKSTPKVKKALNRANHAENAVTINTRTSEVSPKESNRTVNVISIDTKNSDAQRTLLRSLALEKKANPGSSTSKKDSPPQTQRLPVRQSPAASSPGNPAVIMPAYFSNTGQIFATTQNNLGQVQFVPLANLTGGVNYVNTSNTVNTPPPLAPLGVQASSASTATTTSLITVKSTAELREPAPISPSNNPIKAEIEKQTASITELVKEKLETILGNIGNSLPDAQLKIIHAERVQTAALHKKALEELRTSKDKQIADLIARCDQSNKREQALAEQRTQLMSKIEDTKRKQWCACCWKEALFYCCWNTSYCDYPCQQQHWVQHMTTCTQLSPNALPPNATPSLKGNRKNHAGPSRVSGPSRPSTAPRPGGPQGRLNGQGSSNSNNNPITYPGPSSKKAEGRPANGV